MRKFAAIMAATAHLLLLDAVTKELAVHFLRNAEPVPVVAGLFNLAYVENFGCAWGMFQGSVWPLAAFAAAAMAFAVWKRRTLFGEYASGWRRGASATAECLLYAGILGNLIDRVFRGHVVDFLDFFWKGSHFPCFNVADAYLTVAVALLLACSLGDGGKTRDAAA